jgi:putative oxidoreductase
MSLLTKSLQLRFVPASIDLGLLLLRLWSGTAMLVLHGWGKLTGFPTATDFGDPLGIGWKTSLFLAIVGEVVGPVLLILGLFTRLGALIAGVTMAVAFFLSHGAELKGGQSGELAFIYLGTFATLFLTGGGRFAIDMRLAKNSLPKSV